MALTQTGENQRKIGVNLSKIIGLKENAVKMKALNMERQKGGFNAVYFNGRNAGTETGGTDPTCTQCGGGSGGGGGGGSGGGSGGGGSGGGGGVVFPCNDCVTLAEAAEMSETPCCISGGKDCETGDNMPICLAENCGGGEYGKDCTPPAYGDNNTIVISWRNFHCGQYGNTEYLLADMDSGAGVAEQALQKSLDTFLCITGCGGMSAGDKQSLANPSKNGKSFQYYREQIVKSEQCGQWTASCNVILEPNQQQYNAALANWKKPSGKYLKNGKFYDACGIEASDEITVCDENGNQYKIKANNGKPKVTPVTA